MTSWKNNNTLYSMRESGEGKVVVKDKDHLRDLIMDRVDKEGRYCDLNDLDVSQVTDMSYLFSRSEFNGDISNWDVSNVKDMSFMFEFAKFRGDISGWNTSNVKNMDHMFFGSRFNGDISSWDVSNVKNLDSMFFGSRVKGEKMHDWYVEQSRRNQ